MVVGWGCHPRPRQPTDPTCHGNGRRPAFPRAWWGLGAMARLAWVEHSTAGDGVARHSRTQNDTAQHGTARRCSAAHSQLERRRGCISEPASPPPGGPWGFPLEPPWWSCPGLPRTTRPPPCPGKGSKARAAVLGLAPQRWLPLLCELPTTGLPKTWKLALLPLRIT